MDGRTFTFPVVRDSWASLWVRNLLMICRSQIIKVERVLKRDASSIVEVHTEKLERITKPNRPTVDDKDFPTFLFGPWSDSVLTWHQVRSTEGTLYEMTPKKTRLGLMIYTKPTGPERWITEIGSSMIGWVPQFDYFLSLPIHPTTYQIIWLIFHHSLPVKQRLFNHNLPEVSDPYWKSSFRNLNK